MPSASEGLRALASQTWHRLRWSKTAQKGVLLHRPCRSNKTCQYSTTILETDHTHGQPPPLNETTNAHSNGLTRSFTGPPTVHPTTNHHASWSLPVTCPGCGALSQGLSPELAGFYTRSRRAVKDFFRQQERLKASVLVDPTEGKDTEQKQDRTYTGTITEYDRLLQAQEVPICDRCHDLVYNNKGVSIAHPTIQALADSIAESSFRRNHVYHVLDAVDFPLSLIPGIFRTLDLARPRSQNRRSQTKYTSKPTISFVITRSDLLGGSKEMVDKMMPYFQEVLRSALGRQGRDMRLGNVHLVSAKRGWWTKELKDDIWNRGGGNWMVGKANVGKSSLFPVLFPKGSGERAPVYTELEQQRGKEEIKASKAVNDDVRFSEDSLLPPAQAEVPFPAMPIVSHLPGTTASPIRLPFGGNKGELIDLPGLKRGNLEDFVHLDHKLDLVMQSRPSVSQYIIKPGQSLILGGGLIRITPQLDANDPSTVMLAYPFIPIDAHVTSTEKAISMQLQKRPSGVKSVLDDEFGSRITTSGIHALTNDVTKSRASALLRAGVPVGKLPFRVYSCDLLIEGVGWVELVSQVRRRRSLSSHGVDLLDSGNESDSNLSRDVADASQERRPEGLCETEADFKPFFRQSSLFTRAVENNIGGSFPFPKIEVFSPEGRNVGIRRPLGAWMMWDERTKQRQKPSTSGRPRKSMKGMKKREKIARRATSVTSRVL